MAALVRTWCAIALLALACVLPAAGQTASPLAGLAFLIGTWTSDDGVVSGNAGRSRGTSIVESQIGGAVLLRRDHTEVSNADGRPREAFDQIMMIYPEGGAIKAEYSDGTHIIHYVSADVVAGQFVSFKTAQLAGVPAFRLTYEKTAPATIAVRFEIMPPGQAAFVPVASGTLHRQR